MRKRNNNNIVERETKSATRRKRRANNNQQSAVLVEESSAAEKRTARNPQFDSTWRGWWWLRPTCMTIRSRNAIPQVRREQHQRIYIGWRETPDCAAAEVERATSCGPRTRIDERRRDLLFGVVHSKTAIFELLFLHVRICLVHRKSQNAFLTWIYETVRTEQTMVALRYVFYYTSD